MSRVERGGCQAILVILSDRLLWALVREGSPLDGGVLSEPWFYGEGAGQESLDEALSRLKTRLDAAQLQQARVLRVAVAESRLAAALLPWSQGVWRMSEAQNVWRSGLLSADWAIRADATLVAQDAPHGRPRWVMAWDAAMKRSLADFAEACGWRLAGVKPMGAVLRSALPHGVGGEPRLLAVVDDACVTLYLLGHHTHDVLVRPRPEQVRDMDTLATEVQAQLSRQQLRRADWAQARAGSWINAAQATADLGPAWTTVMASHPSLDGFMGVVGRSAGWHHDPLDAVSVSGPAWAAVRAMLVLMLVAAVCLGVHGLWVRQQAAVPAHDATTVASLPAPLVSTTARARRDMQASNNAIALLNLPVSRVLDALQPPRDLPVSLLTLDLSVVAQGASLRVVGEAAEPADMLHYVDYLQLRSPLDGARLVQHERRPSTEGAVPPLHRFTVEATWQP